MIRTEDSATRSPAGTTDNSPAIYRWAFNSLAVKSRQGRKKSHSTAALCPFVVPSLGGLGRVPFGHPPLKQWASFFRPSG